MSFKTTEFKSLPSQFFFVLTIKIFQSWDVPLPPVPWFLPLFIVCEMWSSGLGQIPLRLFYYSLWYPFWTNSYSENNQFFNFVVVIIQSLSCVQHFETHGLQLASLPCASLSPKVSSVSCPSSWWCYLTLSSFVSPFSFCFQSVPASGSFLMKQLFESGGQSIGVSASVVLMNIQNWFF